MELLDGLNNEQRRAVEHTGGPLLVVAGAGTGKTRVITTRIAYLIQQQLARPGQILALTFTEKAAREMEERLYGLIGWQSFQVPVMTFHAFGTELLGRFASHIGRSIRGGLLNDTQKALLLKQHLSRVSLRYYGPQTNMFEFLEGIVAYIGNLQNAAITVDDYDAYVVEIEARPGELHPRDVDEHRDLAALYRLYENLKAETGTFDHHDQLQLPYRILHERPNVAERLSHEYRYVLVDEYQDTNVVQDELLRTFIQPEGNLFAVGDDDQAIYGFRGAEIGNILAFAEHYRLSEPAVLVHNYRSGQAILDAAYRLIRHNDPERLETKLGINKRLIATHDRSIAEYQPYMTPADEQAGVLRLVMERLAQGEPAAGMAVLAATHAPLKAMAKAMRSRGVPFALATSVNIFEQPELIGLWYLLRWLCFTADDEAVGHILMGPLVGWSADEYRQILERSRDRFQTLEETLRADDSEARRALVGQLDQWRGWARELPVSQLAFRLIFDTGKAEQWRNQAADTPRMMRVFEDLQRWFEQMQDFEMVALSPGVTEYCQTFPKPPALESIEPAGDAEGVQLLTVHASKGLEFETVFLVGCTQRSWSGVRTEARPIPEVLRQRPSLPPEHEFRRLMYVAVTRARQHLMVSSALQSAGGSKQAPSLFVAELFGEEALKRPALGGDNRSLETTLSKLHRFYPMQSHLPGSLLPFETADGWLNLSVTQLSRYDFCPFEFYVENVLKIKQPFGVQLAFGSVLHQAFEAYYKAELGGTIRPASELHELLDELWSNRGYDDLALAESDRRLAHETLARFIEREQGTAAGARTILGSEVAIRFDLEDAKLHLRGKIDALFETPEGVEIRDFKTGRTQTNEEKLAKKAKDDLQLRSYALAYEGLNGQPPARVALDYVVTGVEGLAVLSPAILRNHHSKLTALAERIRQHDFAPNPSPMHVCAATRYYGTGEYDALAEEAAAEAAMESQNEA